MIMKLPPPQTFAEGQRKLFGILAAIAGVAYGLAAIAAAAFVVLAHWPPQMDRLRLIILGLALGGAMVGSIAVTLGLLVGGPVGRFSLEATRTGAKLSAEDHAAASVVTTTATTVAPASPPAPPGAG